MAVYFCGNGTMFCSGHSCESCKKDRAEYEANHQRWWDSLDDKQKSSYLEKQMAEIRKYDLIRKKRNLVVKIVLIGMLVCFGMFLFYQF